MARPVAVQFVLSDEEREVLERWARRPKSAQSLALRCRVVLACAEGAPNAAVAEHLGITVTTVRKWRGRFAKLRLDGLHDCAPSWCAEVGTRQRRGSGHCQDPRAKPDGGHALVDTVDGGIYGDVPVGGQPDISGPLA